MRAAWQLEGHTFIFGQHSLVGRRTPPTRQQLGEVNLYALQILCDRQVDIRRVLFRREIVRVGLREILLILCVIHRVGINNPDLDPRLLRWGSEDLHPSLKLRLKKEFLVIKSSYLRLGDQAGASNVSEEESADDDTAECLENLAQEIFVRCVSAITLPRIRIGR